MGVSLGLMVCQRLACSARVLRHLLQLCRQSLRQLVVWQSSARLSLCSSRKLFLGRFVMLPKGGYIPRTFLHVAWFKFTPPRSPLRSEARAAARIGSRAHPDLDAIPAFDFERFDRSHHRSQAGGHRRNSWTI
jgi:hypothetical protein